MFQIRTDLGAKYCFDQPDLKFCFRNIFFTEKTYLFCDLRYSRKQNNVKTVWRILFEGINLESYRPSNDLAIIYFFDLQVSSVKLASSLLGLVNARTHSHRLVCRDWDVDIQSVCGEWRLKYLSPCFCKHCEVTHTARKRLEKNKQIETSLARTVRKPVS